MSQSKALWSIKGGIKYGTARFGKHGSRTGKVKEIVHDGDTLNVILTGNFGVRFLGIDTPEISFQYPGKAAFISAGNAEWEKSFSKNKWQQNLVIDAGLMSYLKNCIGNGKGVHTNHYKLAKEAEENLEKLVQTDLTASGKTEDEFKFFMAFGSDYLDSYGRLLCYIHPDNANFKKPPKNNPSYNEHQLASGYGIPYFIWPNVQPFMNADPFKENNIQPEKFRKKLSKPNKLTEARKKFSEARKNRMGIYTKGMELKLMPFEFRFISRGKGPDRYVIDLSDTGSQQLIQPQNYYTIPNPEDRLWIPKEYVELFRKCGWK